MGDIHDLFDPLPDPCAGVKRNHAIRLAEIREALEDAIRHGSPSERWVAIPHEQWRNLLAAIPHDPNLQPERVR